MPAPLVIRVPYLVLCGVLDTLYDGRPIARFWYLETVARIPYFAYNTMIFLYETLGWWRRSAKLKKTHFQEEWNEFHHLLIMESLGGDQAWFDRFVGQHSALAYYLITLIMWLVSPTLAYNFSELIEVSSQYLVEGSGSSRVVRSKLVSSYTFSALEARSLPPHPPARPMPSTPTLSSWTPTRLRCAISRRPRSR